ncbi:hypothetical protein IFR05_011873 [Cadophora sp. M221]|nr:hypothetical protein IFR05_011873 [Cadophora sp. M221]
MRPLSSSLDKAEVGVIALAGAEMDDTTEGVPISGNHTASTTKPQDDFGTFAPSAIDACGSTSEEGYPEAESPWDRNQTHMVNLEMLCQERDSEPWKIAKGSSKLCMHCVKLFENGPDLDKEKLFEHYGTEKELLDSATKECGMCAQFSAAKPSRIKIYGKKGDLRHIYNHMSKLREFTPTRLMDFGDSRPKLRTFSKTEPGVKITDLDANAEPSVFNWLHRWGNIVKAYSKCMLTIGNDKLVAICGIARTMHGLDDPGQYLAGMWSEKFNAQLCWALRGKTEPRPATYRAPSWSWASCDGPVTTHPWSGYDFFAKLEDVVLHTVADGNMFGEVLGGVLSLSCEFMFVAKVTKFKSMSHTTHSLVIEDRKFPASLFPGTLDDSVMFDDQEGRVYILVLCSTGYVDLLALVLRSTGTAPGRYRKIGLLEIGLLETTRDATKEFLAFAELERTELEMMPTPESPRIKMGNS